MTETTTLLTPAERYAAGLQEAFNRSAYANLGYTFYADKPGRRGGNHGSGHRVSNGRRAGQDARPSRKSTVGTKNNVPVTARLKSRSRS